MVFSSDIPEWLSFLQYVVNYTDQLEIKYEWRIHTTSWNFPRKTLTDKIVSRDLEFSQVKARDEGLYACVVSHPDIVQFRIVNLSVVGEHCKLSRWWYFTRAHALWASYQIRKIAGCACARNAGNVSPQCRFQRKPLVSDPGMHHGTCVTHVPWCMSGSLTCGNGENVPGIPGACAPAILRIWQEAHNIQD